MEDVRRNFLLLSCLVLAFGKTIESCAYESCADQSCVVSFLTWFSKHNRALAANEVVKYDQVIENIGNGYNASTGKFTAPVSGIYSISVTMMSANSNFVHLAIMKNHQELTYVFANKDTHPQASTTLNISLDEGETVSIQRLEHTHGLLEAHPDGRFNVFSGVLIKQM